MNLPFIRQNPLSLKPWLIFCSTLLVGGFIAPLACQAQDVDALIGLGSATDFAVLSLVGGVQISQGAIYGNVGIADPGTGYQMSGPSNIFDGSVYVHSGSTFKNSSNGQSKNLQASSNDSLLDQAEASALNAATYATRLGSDATFRTSQNFTLAGTYGNIAQSTTIATGSAGNYVLNIGGINLSSSQTITLSGSANSNIVIDVSGTFQLSGSSAIVLTGGLTANNVIYNVIGSGNVSLSGNSVVTGTVLATQRTFQTSSMNNIKGQVMAGSISISNGGVVSPEF